MRMLLSARWGPHSGRLLHASPKFLVRVCSILHSVFECNILMNFVAATGEIQGQRVVPFPQTCHWQRQFLQSLITMEQPAPHHIYVNRLGHLLCLSELLFNCEAEACPGVCLRHHPSMVIG
jgi:hypothetical protein